jgi:hypothetical protein
MSSPDPRASLPSNKAVLPAEGSVSADEGRIRVAFVTPSQSIDAKEMLAVLKEYGLDEGVTLPALEELIQAAPVLMERMNAGEINHTSIWENPSEYREIIGDAAVTLLERWVPMSRSQRIQPPDLGEDLRNTERTVVPVEYTLFDPQLESEVADLFVRFGEALARQYEEAPDEPVELEQLLGQVSADFRSAVVAVAHNRLTNPQGGENG